jgi:transposase
MLSFAGSLKVFVALEACDMRKSFNGLHALVSEQLNEDPRQGALFVFSNRRGTRLKILYWDRSGYWLLIMLMVQEFDAVTFADDCDFLAVGWLGELDDFFDHLLQTSGDH